MYVAIRDNSVIGYSKNLKEFSEKYPNEDMIDAEFVIGEDSEEPLYDPIREYTTWEPQFNDGVWKQVWSVNNLLPEQITKNINQKNDAAISSRARCYRLESDPLFFKFQRGEASEEEWISKIEEIKQRYPKIPLE